MTTFDPKQHLGTSVTIRGTAYDARAGAIVELDDRTPIYIAGLDSWDDTLRDKPIEVTGLLKERAPKVPKAAPGGAQVHGMTGSTYVLEDATWQSVG